MRILGLILLVVAAFQALAQAPVRGGELPGPLPLFPLTNWWNVDVTHAPVDANSAAFVDYIGRMRGMHPDFGGDSGDPEAPIYGMPYIVVSGNQALVPVTFEYDDESDIGAPGRPPGYPIPEEAKTQQRWIEGGLAGNDPNAEGDRHMLIVDRDHRILYELFALHWTGSRWEAGSGATFPLDSNTRRPDGWTSADAAGLAILPGLIRYDEAYGPDPIRHAFRVTVRSTNGYVYPGSHRAGDTVGALPMGARLRLKSSVDVSQFAESLRKIFQAMKTYGLIVADNGSDLYVSGTYDTRWDNDILNPAFSAITADDFEVVQLGWEPAGLVRDGARFGTRPVRPAAFVGIALGTYGRFEARSSAHTSWEFFGLDLDVRASARSPLALRTDNHRTPRSRMTAARAARRSLTAWGLDTAKALGHSYMHGEIVAAIRIRGPAILKSVCVVPQLVADLQSLGGRHPVFQCLPTAPLRRRDGRPIPASEGHDVLSPHRARIAK